MTIRQAQSTPYVEDGGGEMELDEAFARLVRRHIRLHVALLVLAAMAITALGITSETTYVASGRVLLTSQHPRSTQESGAVVARASAAVTSRSMVERALKRATAQRGPQQPTLIRDVDSVRRAVQVQQLGTSTLAELTVTDADPMVAAQLATSLEEQLVAFSNELDLGHVQQAVADIDEQLAQLRQQLDSLAKEDALAGQPSDARQRRATAAAQLLTQLSAERSRLLVGQQLAATATIVDKVPAMGEAARSKLITYAALVVFAAVIVSLLIAGSLEVARPSVPGPRYAARALQAPFLGELTPAFADEPRERTLPTLHRLLLASRQADVHALVLAGPMPDEQLRSMSRDLEAALRRIGAATDAASTPVWYPQTVGTGAKAKPPWSDSPDVGDGTSPRAAGPGVGANPGFNGADTPQVAVRVVSAPDLSLVRHPGLVVMVPRVARRSDLDVASDLAELSRWPVLGVVAVPGDNTKKGSAR